MFVFCLSVLCLLNAANAVFSPERQSVDSLAQQVADMKSHYDTQIAGLQHQVSGLQDALKDSRAEVTALQERVPTRFAGEEGVTAILQRQFTVDNNQPIPFDDVISIAPGTTYDATTGEFTCVTGGFYWASASIYLISTTTTLTPSIVMNFEEQASAYVYNIGTSIGISASVSAFINCPANGKIWVRTAENSEIIGTPINQSSSFSVFFLV